MNLNRKIGFLVTETLTKCNLAIMNKFKYLGSFDHPNHISVSGIVEDGIKLSKNTKMGRIIC